MCDAPTLCVDEARPSRAHCTQSLWSRQQKGGAWKHCEKPRALRRRGRRIKRPDMKSPYIVTPIIMAFVPVSDRGCFSKHAVLTRNNGKRCRGCDPLSLGEVLRQIEAYNTEQCDKSSKPESSTVRPAVVVLAGARRHGLALRAGVMCIRQQILKITEKAS